MPVALTIGNFDGVHRGHQALLSASREAAGEHGSIAALFFDPHPAAFFGRGPNALLTSSERRAALLKAYGVDRVSVRAFDAAFAAQSPQEFVRDVVVAEHHPDVVVVGPDFRFGQKAAGTTHTLRELGEEHGFSVQVLSAVNHEGSVVSSTRIRAALSGGAIEEANRLLGRAHDLDGVVVKGDQRGRTIGFPTANLQTESVLAPGDGVYSVVVRTPSGIHRGMANLGTRPTFEAGRSMEVHLFDFAEDIYDQIVRVAFVARVRDERRFDGIDSLIDQLRRDEITAREQLETHDEERWRWI